MADISAIKLPSGTTYNVKDISSRGSIEAIKSAVNAINSAVGANTDRREGTGSVSYSSSSIIIPDIHLRSFLYKIDITLARKAQYGPVYLYLKHADGTVIKTFEIPASDTTYSENFDTVYMEETGCYIEVQKYSTVITPIACTVVFDKQYQSSDNISKKLDAPAEDGTAGQVLATDGNGGTEWVDLPEGGSGGLSDVRIDGTSVVQNGTAYIPVGSTSGLGVVKASGTYGTTVYSSGTLGISGANASMIKSGINQYSPITPLRQHEAAFYGLAKAAGDSTQQNSSNAVGQYTDDAKASILSMLGVLSLFGTVEGNTASKAYSYGEAFIYKGKLCRATSSIAQNDTIDYGVNCVETNIIELLSGT